MRILKTTHSVLHFLEFTADGRFLAAAEKQRYTGSNHFLAWDLHQAVETPIPIAQLPRNYCQNISLMAGEQPKIVTSGYDVPIHFIDLNSGTISQTGINSSCHFLIANDSILTLQGQVLTRLDMGEAGAYHETWNVPATILGYPRFCVSAARDQSQFYAYEPNKDRLTCRDSLNGDIMQEMTLPSTIVDVRALYSLAQGSEVFIETTDWFWLVSLQENQILPVFRGRQNLHYFTIHPWDNKLLVLTGRVYDDDYYEDYLESWESSDNVQSLELWDLRTGASLQKYDWEIGPAQRVAISPDGCLAAVAYTNLSDEMTYILLWDLDD